MTEAEKEFEKINSKFFDFEDIHYDKIKKGVMQAYLDGQKAGYEQCEKTQPFNDHKCNNCTRMTVSQDEYIRALEEQYREAEEQIEKMKAELHHILVSPSHSDSDCLDKIISLDRLWQFGQEF